MWSALITVVPVGLVLGLLEFGRYAHRTPVPPTPGRVIPVAVLTILLGPVTAAAIGLLAWFGGVAILTALILMVAVWRTPARTVRG